MKTETALAAPTPAAAATLLSMWAPSALAGDEMSSSVNVKASGQTAARRRRRIGGAAALLVSALLLAACTPTAGGSTYGAPQPSSHTTPVTTPLSTPAASCSPRPCGSAGGVSIALTDADPTIYTTRLGIDNDPIYQQGGLELAVTITNGSTARLVPNSQQFTVTDSTGHGFGQRNATVRSQKVTELPCNWALTGLVDLAPGAVSSPQRICFPILPADQKGVMYLTWAGPYDPATLTIDIPFTLDGNRLSASGASATNPPPNKGAATNPPPNKGAGSVPDGTYTGTYQGLSAKFSSAGSTVSGLTFTGLWSCAGGAAEMVAAVPGSFRVAADGSFGGKYSGTSGGADATWQVSGRISGSSASGTVTVTSAAACALYDAPWSASLS